MTDSLKLKNRLIKILKVLPVEEIEPKNKDVKFALKITPFQSKNFMVIVEYFHKVDMIRVIPTIGIGKNIRDNYKTKKEPEKREIVKIFAKPIRVRNFNAIILNDFSSIQGFKILIQQNLSAQMLLDTVNEGIFLLQDLGDLLHQADQSLKIPKVNDTGNNMFQ